MNDFSFNVLNSYNYINHCSTKLNNLNFHALEVLKKTKHLIYKDVCLNAHVVPNNSDRCRVIISIKTENGKRL